MSASGVGGEPDGLCQARCASPPQSTCKDANTQTTFLSDGTCISGTCVYSPSDTGCGGNKQCAGAGECSECKADSSCGATCVACGGATPKCKDLGTTSQCVACLSNADCSGATPVCNTTTDVCGPPPSCIGLPATCGGNANCCASSVVTRGTFNRGNDAAYPATVADFRLDTYEITVGRFRAFWNVYPKNMPVAGSGKNPNNASDPGWDVTWNTSSLPPSQDALTANIKCAAAYQTWTARDDNLPMNCIDWFEAEAFCIWDGGRLPTEAEWNYAAAGGSAQSLYPWGSAAPDCTYANFNNGARCVAAGTNRVGSESPKGDGLYGQADLAGNVSEWVQDWYVNPYLSPCTNCASTAKIGDGLAGRVVRGGDWLFPATSMTSLHRRATSPAEHDADYGGRCARTP
jgi:sulfatase modifying factor 1